MHAEPITIQGKKLKNLFASDVGMPGTIQLMIMKEDSRGLRQIGKTSIINRDLFENESDENARKYVLYSAFIMIHCKVCRELFPAIQLTQSPLGHICEFCWKQAEPSFEWIPLDELEKYVKTI